MIPRPTQLIVLRRAVPERIGIRFLEQFPEFARFRRRRAELMIEFDVGATTVRTYPVKRVDLDYFEEA